jgi:hypothetical protein
MPINAIHSQNICTHSFRSMNFPLDEFAMASHVYFDCCVILHHLYALADNSTAPRQPTETRQGAGVRRP